MGAATAGARSAAFASSPLKPYAHQLNAVYGAMLPQPNLRFLLADEPGTGKTIMAGMYLREMQRLGFISRALVVAPAHLVTKWQADFERFFGGGLRPITAQTVREHALETDHDLWIVSLDLAAVNPAVQAAIHPDRAGWDAVVFDEAHRLTPTAASYYQAGELLALNTPRALFMTATPHRGKEWLFRALLHLVDPDVYPPVAANEEPTHAAKPGRVHFLRRMKEDLVDFDGVTKLFKGRRATNETVPLNPTEADFYAQALDLVDRFFPANAVPLGRMVYGKRAASSLYALAETLKRRRDGMGSAMPAAAALEADPDGDDPSKADEAKVIVESSRAAKQERKEINGLLARLEPLLADPRLPVSKWDPLVLTCLGANGIKPGNGEQAVVFTEYADTADWLVRALTAGGFTARRYSGRDLHPVRDAIRDGFARGDFQILVSTDAGNEGIDLQTAHVLVNWDIPWSLVRLEQRMGRIHRVGQTRDVELYNLIATETREGDVLEVLLRNFVTAANQLDGRMFDSLSLVGELVGLTDDRLTEVLSAAFGDDQQRAAGADCRSGCHLGPARRRSETGCGAGSGSPICRRHRRGGRCAPGRAARPHQPSDRRGVPCPDRGRRCRESGPARRRGRDLHSHPARRGNPPPRIRPAGASPPRAGSRRRYERRRTHRSAQSERGRVRGHQSRPERPSFPIAGRPVRRPPCASNVSRRHPRRRDQRNRLRPVLLSVRRLGGRRQAQGHLVVPHPCRCSGCATGAVGDAR